MLALPRLIGHRGAAASAPENTLASLRQAAAEGARWVEFDVVLSRDGVSVLFHDDLLDRTSSGSGPVEALTLAELRALDAGRWFGPAFAGERIATFEEGLALCAELELGINIEIKPTAGREAETAHVALALARRLWPAGLPVLVSSFARDSLLAAREAAPDWPRGFLFDREPADWQDFADRIAAATINVNQRVQTAETVARYAATGRPVLCFTVNDPAKARELFTWGVAGVFTDAPGPMAAALGDA